MKSFSRIILLLLMPCFAFSQQSKLDSLKDKLAIAITDSAKYDVLTQLGSFYTEDKRDSALYYFDKALAIAKQNNNKLDVASTLDSKGYVLMHMGNLPLSLQCFIEAVKLAENPDNENRTFYKKPDNEAALNRLFVLENIHHDWGHLMGNINVDAQIFHYQQTQKIATATKDTIMLGFVNMNLGRVYMGKANYDTALVMELAAEKIFIQSGEERYLAVVYIHLGNIYLHKLDKPNALRYFHKAIPVALNQNNIGALSEVYGLLSSFYLNEKNKDSSLYYSRKFLEVSNAMGNTDLSQPYYQIYKSYQLCNNIDSAYKYQGMALAARDSSFQKSIENLTELQKSSFAEQQHLQELEQEKIDTQNKFKFYAAMSALILFLLAGIVLYRNNRQKQKANAVLESTLNDLKSTQTQLIQQEKLASLGALTAGIAHEIKNPLNFVNNFSELSNELIKEFKESKSEEERNEILTDLELNLEKINHHGKRADSIVKNMLQHSRSGTGEKQLTDLNQLCEEFLNLAYHGKRASNQNFNCEMIKQLDPNLPLVNCVAQDISRVILNLINNAFDSVNERSEVKGEREYKPTVSITTEFTPSPLERVGEGSVLIKVKDNGRGIPSHIKEKIFEPFFTTKPAGQGTGLGLSLSYDIVKAHGGTIEVNSKENEGTEFVITLPV